MSCALVAFTSRPVPLSSLGVGERAVVCGASDAAGGRLERLLALGITPGAMVTMLQRFPGVVFLCDQTELAVERGVADAISVKPMESVR